MKTKLIVFTFILIIINILSCTPPKSEAIYLNVSFDKLNDSLPGEVDIEYSFESKVENKTIDQNWELIGKGYYEDNIFLKATKKKNIKNLSIKLNWLTKEKKTINQYKECSLDSNSIELKQNLW